MDNDKLKKSANGTKANVRRSIEVIPEEFLLMLTKGKQIINKDLANTLNNFGQVYLMVKKGDGYIAHNG